MRRQRLSVPAVRSVVTPVLLALLLLGTTSCGFLRVADDVGRSADDIGRGADELGGAVPPPEVPGVPPAAAGAGSQDAVQLADQLVAAHTSDLDPETARQVVWSACTADGLLEARQAATVAEAVGKVLADHGGRGTFHVRVEGLTEDLRKARTSGERVWLRAKFAVCEIP